MARVRPRGTPMRPAGRPPPGCQVLEFIPDVARPVRSDVPAAAAHRLRAQPRAAGGRVDYQVLGAEVPYQPAKEEVICGQSQAPIGVRRRRQHAPLGPGARLGGDALPEVLAQPDPLHAVPGPVRASAGTRAGEHSFNRRCRGAVMEELVEPIRIALLGIRALPGTLADLFTSPGNTAAHPRWPAPDRAGFLPRGVTANGHRRAWAAAGSVSAMDIRPVMSLPETAALSHPRPATPAPFARDGRRDCR